jgi:hypothetical protein
MTAITAAILHVFWARLSMHANKLTSGAAMFGGLPTSGEDFFQFSICMCQSQSYKDGNSGAKDSLCNSLLKTIDAVGMVKAPETQEVYSLHNEMSRLLI